MTILWDVISQADQKKLRKLMPKYWRCKRPKEDTRGIHVELKVNLEQVEQLMKQIPKGPMR